MRQESEALEAVLAITATKLAENRAALGAESARLMSLGDEATDRIGRVTQFLARESAELDRKAQALDQAAAAARVDIGVLMSDLPKVEEQARAAAEAMKQAGLGAHEQALALESQLAALAARSREADEAAGGSAQRLGAHIARIESGAGAAAERMIEAAAQMNGAVDGAMERAAQSVDQARQGLEAQGQTMLAMIEQSRAAFEQAGAETTKGLAERLDLAGQKIEMLAGRLATQDQASRTLLGNIARQIDEVGRQIAHIGESGDAQNARLAESMGALRTTAQALQREIAEGETQSEALTGRAQALGAALAQVTAQLRSEMPPAMAGIEIQAERTAAAAQTVTGEMERMRIGREQCRRARRDNRGEHRAPARIARRPVRVAARGRARRRGETGLAERLVGEADGAAAQMVRDTGPELVDALVRVREAAAQAASHAREAIAAVIPESVEALVEAAGKAMGEAVAQPVKEQLAEIGNASHLALATAKAASERLTRQLLTIGETAAAIEDRIAEDRAEREAREAHALSQRVSLIIDALNSTAIDVSKILSNDAGDAAWAAYLKGDRGVFTRRAVQLARFGRGTGDPAPLRGGARLPRPGEPLHRRFRGDAAPRARRPRRLRARHHPALLRHGQALRRARPGDRAAAPALVRPVEVFDGDPAIDVIGVIEAEQDRRDDGGAQRRAREAEGVGRAFGMAGLDLGAGFLGGAHAEGQDEEQADRPEQDVDGEDRGPAHQIRTIRTLTTGFLPVHSVAQRRTARRTASRSLSSSLPPFFATASAAASRASARKAARSSSTGTP